MGTGSNSPSVKKVKLAKCSVCRKVPSPDCEWNQGRCPHRDPSISTAVIHNFINFFKRWK